MSKEATMARIQQLGEDLEIKDAVLVVGETYAHKAEMKAMGGRWDRELQGWFIPCENGAEVSDTPKAQAKPKAEPKQASKAQAKPKERKLTKAERRRGESVWDVELSKITYEEGWTEKTEIVFAGVIVAKTAQQVKIRAMSTIRKWADEDNEGDSELAVKKRKIKVAVELADSTWVEVKSKQTAIGEVPDEFRRRIGVSEKYKIDVR